MNKFTQVLINLVSNALNFAHVTDVGVGDPLALQPYLFGRFTKARRPGLRGEATTGLGLALCKTIVEWRHG